MFWRGTIHDDAVFGRLMRGAAAVLALLVAVGAVLLRWRGLQPVGGAVTWLDAIYTSTSAVCGVGLSVVGIGSGFNPAGRMVIAGLIELGALVYMVMGCAVALRAQRRWADWREGDGQSVGALVQGVVLTAIVVQLIGAVLLTAFWPDDGSRVSFGERLHRGLFHAISGYCNSGLSLEGDSLRAWRYSWAVHWVMGPLIVLGGLGYPVLADLGRWMRKGGRLAPLTRAALVMTLLVYLLGVVAFTSAQLKPHLDQRLDQGVESGMVRPPPLTAGEFGRTVADAHFMTVSARTAGFETVAIDRVQPAGRVALMALMSVGAMPGGSAGGVGLLAVFFLVGAVRRGAGRRLGWVISAEAVRWAGVLLAGFVGLVILSVFLLSLSEPQWQDRLVMESVSAASGSGMSWDIAYFQTRFGQVVEIGTMLLGRLALPLLAGRMLLGGSEITNNQ